MLLEVLQEYYKLIWTDFTHEMKDRWSPGDFEFSRQCHDKKREMEENILSFARRPDAFEEFSKCIEEMDPDVFQIMIANLDSKPDKYETLFDLFEEHNNIHISKIVIPDSATKIIPIKK